MGKLVRGCSRWELLDAGGVWSFWFHGWCFAWILAWTHDDIRHTKSTCFWPFPEISFENSVPKSIIIKIGKGLSGCLKNGYSRVSQGICLFLNSLNHVCFVDVNLPVDSHQIFLKSLPPVERERKSTRWETLPFRHFELNRWSFAAHTTASVNYNSTGAKTSLESLRESLFIKLDRHHGEVNREWAGESISGRQRGARKILQLKTISDLSTLIMAI